MSVKQTLKTLYFEAETNFSTSTRSAASYNGVNRIFTRSSTAPVVLFPQTTLQFIRSEYITAPRDILQNHTYT
jgi:hypothetical protein